MAEHTIGRRKKARAVALLKLGTPFLLLSFLFLAARFYAEHVAPMHTCEQLKWMRLVALVGAVGLLSIAFAFVRSGLRIWRAGQFPAPGTSVLFTTQVSTGWWVRSQAVSRFIFAALAIVGLAGLLRFFIFSGVGPFVLGLRSCGP